MFALATGRAIMRPCGSRSMTSVRSNRRECVGVIMASRQCLLAAAGNGRRGSLRRKAMKMQRLLIVLTLVNLGLLVLLLLSHIGPASANGAAPVLRGRALEIVDELGRVRASLNVLPASKQPNGETSSETVLLRLITERGRPSVKIGASEQSAGVSFAGPSGTKDTYVILEAKGMTTSLRLRNEDGREQIVKP